jgi:glycosyltransferase involved in cell wall biosynthesis
MQTQTVTQLGIPSNRHGRPPTVLQVLPSLRSGGVERGTIEIARELQQKGWRALVASEGGAMESQLARIGVKHIRMPLATKNPLKMWINAIRLEQVIHDYKVDIVHARSRAPAWSAWMAAGNAGARFVTTFHGAYSLQNRFKLKYNSVMAKGERVIAISHFIADHIRQNYRVPEEHLRTIQRGVDTKLFSPSNYAPQRMIELSKEWRLPEALPLILFPGRITRWKGQDVFLKALAKVPHRNFFAVILGDATEHPAYSKELEDLIHKLDLAGHVRIAGHTHHMTEAYMLAKLVVATSLDPEPFGRVVLEAQAMGKPVIATNQGGPQETVVPNVTGWLVTPGDINELESALAYALSLDEEVQQWMSAQAIANAKQFSTERMCEHTLAVYQELL